jgi:hypothetical protein
MHHTAAFDSKKRTTVSGIGGSGEASFDFCWRVVADAVADRSPPIKKEASPAWTSGREVFDERSVRSAEMP